MGWLSWCIKDLWGTKVMYCYVVKWPVFSLQRGSAKWPIAPSNFSSLWINWPLHMAPYSSHFCNSYFMSQHAVTYPRNRSADFEDVRSVCWPTNKPYADLPVLAVWWPTYLWFLRSLTYHISSHNYILYELLFVAMVLL